MTQDKLQEYERALEGLEEMITVVDREYRYRIANDKFLRMRKMTREQVVGRFAYEVLNKGVFEAVIKEKLDQAFQGRVVKYEMKYTYPELGERDILVSYFPIDGENGVDRVACIVRDITDRNRLEEALRRLSRKLMVAHEDERLRIARDLHDDIMQRLVYLGMTLDSLNRLPRTADELTRDLGAARKQIADLGTDIQALSHRLHCPRLELLGLSKAATALCEELSGQQGVKIDFHARNVPRRLPREISLSLFRILQEALQNALKHSGSRHFQVVLRTQRGEIDLIVQDSGCGFEPEEAINGPGIGLASMRERLRLVNGHLSIHSQPQRGTTIHARVPRSLKKKSAQTAGG